MTQTPPTPDTLTVQDLRELLSGYPDDTPVLLAAASGDYWGTTLAQGISGGETAEVRYSSYHQSFMVPDPDQEQDSDAPLSEVLLLE